MPSTALLVPAPELDPVVQPGPKEPGAHLTLLRPFLPPDQITEGVLAELESFFGDVVPFLYRLTEVHRFPSGIVYLAPEPARPFRRLTLELARRFPEAPPYEGRFAEVVPHLTLPDEPGPELEALLPVSAYADEAVLLAIHDDGFEELRRFEFGTTAA